MRSSRSSRSRRTPPWPVAPTRAYTRWGTSSALDVGGGPPVERTAEALNTLLPDDVAAVAAEEAPSDFHARHSARSRSYRYRIYRRRERSPLEVRRSWWYPRRIDLDALAASADLLLGEHDFRAFTPTETQHDVFLRRVLALRGTSGASTSTSRSPPTRSSGTWCARSSARCSTGGRRRSLGCSTVRPGRTPAPRRRPGASTWSAWTTRSAELSREILISWSDRTARDTGRTGHGSDLRAHPTCAGREARATLLRAEASQAGDHRRPRRAVLPGEEPGGWSLGRVGFRPVELPDVLTLEQLHGSCRPQRTPRGAAEAGELPGRLVGGEWRFSRQAVLAWLEGDRT